MAMLEYKEKYLGDQVSVGSTPMLEYQEEDFGDQVPVGYRFVPTDEELTHYLIKRVLSKPLPAASVSVFLEINATMFFSKPPKHSVQFFKGEREWFFFIRINGEQYKPIRKVGKGLGFWKSEGEKPLLDTDGKVFASKSRLIYFSGCISKAKKAKKTHWKIDEYRLLNQFYTLRNPKEEWVVARLRRGSERLSS